MKKGWKIAAAGLIILLLFLLFLRNDCGSFITILWSLSAHFLQTCTEKTHSIEVS